MGKKDNIASDKKLGSQFNNAILWIASEKYDYGDMRQGLSTLTAVNLTVPSVE